MPAARLSDPPTSHEAAASVVDVRQSQAAVLGVFLINGPIPDETLVAAYQNYAEHHALPRQSPSGIRTRRHELVERGLLADTGERVKLASGRSAVVWGIA